MAVKFVFPSQQKNLPVTGVVCDGPANVRDAKHNIASVIVIAFWL